MEVEGVFQIEPEVEPSGSMLRPLLMEEILDIVFRHLLGSPKDALENKDTHGATKSRKDIRSCRLVCKAWKKSATSIYRDVAPYLEFALFRSMDDMIDMHKFLETMKDSSMIPRAYYKIWLQNPHQIVDVWNGQRLLNEFLLVCGNEVMKLDFDITDDSLLKLFGSLTHWNMPSLKHLKINITQKSVPNQPLWIKQLLVSAEKLYHFEFSLDVGRGFVKEEAYESELMLQTLQVLPGTVKSLHLNFGTLKDSHLQQLTERNLHLDELILFPRSSMDCSHETIFKFFSGQSDTLATLKLGGCSPRLISEEFPQLKELHHLDFEGYFAPHPISFRDTFPKVSILRFDYVFESGLRKSNLICLNEAPSVRSLRFDFPVSVTLVRNFAECFKNLRVLNLSRVHNIAGVLRQVFVLFSDIQEFAVRLAGILENGRSASADSLFSGIPDADCRQILKSKNYNNFRLDTVRRNPSLLNMPKLKKLTVTFNESDELGFSDVAVHLVFLKMNALEELRVSKLKVSGSSLALLKNKLKVLKAEVMDVDYNEPISDATAAVSGMFL